MMLRIASVALVLLASTTADTAGPTGNPCEDSVNDVWNPVGEVCFKLLANQGNQRWEKVKQLCDGRPAILPLIGEVEWFQNLRRTNDVWRNAGDLWLGAKRADEMGWEWSKQEGMRPIKFADWGGTEPIIKKPNKDYCAVSHGENAVKTSAPFQWSAELCTKKFGVVCEYAPKSSEEK